MPPLAVLSSPHRLLRRPVKRWLLRPGPAPRAFAFRAVGSDQLACVSRDAHDRRRWRVTYVWTDDDGNETPTGHIEAKTLRAALFELSPERWTLWRVFA